MRRGTLMAAGFDPPQRNLTAGGVALVDGVIQIVPSDALTDVDRRNGVSERLDLPSRGFPGARLSPDGSRLAVSLIGSSARGNVSVWIHDLRTGHVSHRYWARASAVLWAPGAQTGWTSSTRL